MPKLYTHKNSFVDREFELLYLEAGGQVGEQGPQGPIGAIGPDGSKGPDGEIGPVGDDSLIKTQRVLITVLDGGSSYTLDVLPVRHILFDIRAYILEPFDGTHFVLGYASGPGWGNFYATDKAVAYTGQLWPETTEYDDESYFEDWKGIINPSADSLKFTCNGATAGKCLLLVSYIDMLAWFTYAQTA